jgi:hypothetical protein
VIEILGAVAGRLDHDDAARGRGHVRAVRAQSATPLLAQREHDTAKRTIKRECA